MYNNELYHYGVLGMKWGVRKDRGSSGPGRVRKAAGAARTRAKTRRASTIQKRHDKAMDVRSSAKYTYRQRKLLSDAELQRRISRLNMERTLKDLAADEGFATSIIRNGRKAAQKGVGVYGAKVIADAIVPGMGSYIPKPKK